jgi:phage-related holin
VATVKDESGYHMFNALGILWASLTKVTIPQWILAFFATSWAWVAPSESLAKATCALLAFTLIDFIVGVRASIKRGKFIRSRLLGKIVDKSLAYGCLFIIGVILHKAWPQYPAVAFLWDLFISAAAARELTSILEKLAILGVPYAKELATVLKVKTDEAVDKGLDRIKDADLNPLDGK